MINQNKIIKFITINSRVFTTAEKHLPFYYAFSPFSELRLSTGSFVTLCSDLDIISLVYYVSSGACIHKPKWKLYIFTRQRLVYIAHQTTVLITGPLKHVNLFRFVDAKTVLIQFCRYSNLTHNNSAFILRNSTPCLKDESSAFSHFLS